MFYLFYCTDLTSSFYSHSYSNSYSYISKPMLLYHYNDVIMSTMASQITSITTLYSIIYWSVHQRKHQSSASLTFMRGIHRGPVNSPHKGPVTRKMFPFDEVIMMMLWSIQKLHQTWYSSQPYRNECVGSFQCKSYDQSYSMTGIMLPYFTNTFMHCSMRHHSLIWIDFKYGMIKWSHTQ